MDFRYQELVAALKDRDKEVRLNSLRQLMDAVKAGQLNIPPRGDHVNNHIHTTYSFSSYSPTMAIWEAYGAGLRSAGIMDHDSICGAHEFIEAGTIVDIATTIGVECRADFSSTTLRGRRINNPDQISNAYISLHGIPHTRIADVTDYFKPFMLARQKRNRLMTDRINQLFSPFNIALSYERDILPLSNHFDGGTVTERHLLYALALRLVRTFGKGESLVEFLKGNMGIPAGSLVNGYLLDKDNKYYEYDLLGLLKAEFVEAFYVDATDECPEIGDVVAFSKSCNCICAYAYLGDVETSRTGDKKPQKFEDDYLDELIALVKELGFDAVTYMPSRNSPSQLERIMNLCRQNGFLQISGEDINSPRQPFVCNAMRNGEFRHLVDTTWALIGHEKAATADNESGFFSSAIIKKFPDLNQRIQFFKAIGLNSHATAASPQIIV